MFSLFSTPLPIITIESDQKQTLLEKTVDLKKEELKLSQEIGKKLIETLALQGAAAGLAAPQIGINRSVFIYSPDRDPKNLEIITNPFFKPIGEKIVLGWEACFSVELKIVKLPRYDTIAVTYLDLSGNHIEKILSGFAAKVFQHEYDHLQGTLICCKKDAEVISFDSEEAMLEFINEVKKEDSKRY